MGTVTVYLNAENEALVQQAAQAWAYKHGSKPSLTEMARNCILVGARYFLEDQKKREKKE